MSGSVSGTYGAAASVAAHFKGEMNIPEMIMAIQIERSNVLDSQIKDQMEDMKKRNDWLREANEALSTLRANRPESDKGTVNYGSIDVTIEDKATGEQTTSSKTVDQWLVDNGVTVKDPNTDNLGTQAEFQSAIDNLKTAIDTVNSQSQMDMVRLQGLMDKRNQAFDMMTNTLSKSGKSLDSIIGNMR